MHFLNKIFFDQYLSKQSISEKPVQIYTGVSVMGLPSKKLNEFAYLISSTLAKYPNTMLQYSPKYLLESMKNGNSVLIVSPDNDLLAFGQLWIYGQDNKGQQVFEFGSWLSFLDGRGFGKKILLEASTLGKTLDPNSQVIAIVEKENIKAQKIIKSAGGKEIGYKKSLAIKNPQGKWAKMKIYDLTDLEGNE